MSGQKNKPTSLNTQTNPYMRLYSKLTLSLLALLGATTLHAQTTDVYITGSTAFRSSATTAIHNLYGGTDTLVFSNNSTTPGGANQATFKGTISGIAGTVYIHTSWSGSEGGIQTVAGSSPTVFNVNFISDATVDASGAAWPAGFAVPAETDAHHPEIAFSDTYQGTSQFHDSFGGETYDNLTEADGTTSGHGSPVGVVLFKWCANNGATVTNMTSQLARSLYALGRRPLSMFTGNTADSSKLVVALGRDIDSGTRLTTFAETGIGALTTVDQFQPQDSTSTLVKTTSATITKFVPWPAETKNGIATGLFHGGYGSGGDLSKAMRAPLNSSVTVTVGATTGTYSAANLTRIAYLGTGDADSNLLAGTGAGVELSYNGVSLGNVGGNYNTSTVVTEGEYTFWGYEHVLYNASTITADVKLAADKLATQLHDVDSPLLLSNMKVKRTTDGATVTNIATTTP
jgi:hypothetical protein